MKTSNEQKAPGSNEKTKTADSKGQQQQQENQNPQKQQDPKQSTFIKEKDKS